MPPPREPCSCEGETMFFDSLARKSLKRCMTYKQTWAGIRKIADAPEGVRLGPPSSKADAAHAGRRPPASFYPLRPLGAGKHLGSVDFVQSRITRSIMRHSFLLPAKADGKWFALNSRDSAHTRNFQQIQHVLQVYRPLP